MPTDRPHPAPSALPSPPRWTRRRRPPGPRRRRPCRPLASAPSWSGGPGAAPIVGSRGGRGRLRRDQLLVVTDGGRRGRRVQLHEPGPGVFGPVALVGGLLAFVWTRAPRPLALLAIKVRCTWRPRLGGLDLLGQNPCWSPAVFNPARCAGGSDRGRWRTKRRPARRSLANAPITSSVMVDRITTGSTCSTRVLGADGDRRPAAGPGRRAGGSAPVHPHRIRPHELELDVEPGLLDELAGPLLGQLAALDGTAGQEPPPRQGAPLPLQEEVTSSPRSAYTTADSAYCGRSTSSAGVPRTSFAIAGGYDGTRHEGEERLGNRVLEALERS